MQWTERTGWVSYRGQPAVWRLEPRRFQPAQVSVCYIMLRTAPEPPPAAGFAAANAITNATVTATATGDSQR